MTASSGSHERRRLGAFLLAYSLLTSLFGQLPLMSSAAAATAQPAARAAAQRREGELIVRFNENVSDNQKNDFAATRGARRARKLRGASRVEVLELAPGQDPAAAAAELRLNEGVELAEPNFVIARSQLTPNDTKFGEQWALSNSGQGGGVAGADVRAAAAWATTTGGVSTVVAVIDSGIDFTHPDLAANRWGNPGERPNRKDDDRNGFADDFHGWDWVADSATVRDGQGHGTAVAGVIAAQGNNGEGIAGVMWRASLMSLRVLDDTGSGSVADAVEAVDYAVAAGAQVINCSWGTDGESVALRDAIGRAGKAGVVVVTSAGNNSRDIDAQPYYPASYNLPNLIAVASTDGSDSLAAWSDWGGRGVAVAAPGADILTTKAGGGYWTLSGTSLSAPFVAGVAGLVKTVAPRAPAEVVRDSIVKGSRRVITLGGWVSSGGVVNAAGALEAASTAGNPYTAPGGNGNNGNGNNGNGNGNNGNGQGAANPRPPNPGHGGRNREDFKGEAPAPTQGAVGNLPNLDQLAGRRSYVPSAPPQAIHADANPICSYCYNPPGTNDPQFSTARTTLDNETGKPGVDLGSRNFNWGTPLVNVPGRAGLDLNLSLYYNSLVWTKQGTSMQYNADNGFPGPGFRLGLPAIQQRYYDSTSGAYAYMMITPSGGRVPMRQVGSTSVYKSLDGSYTQFDDGANLLRTTDGTRYYFVNVTGGEKRCTQVRDRNGNYISAAYDGGNRLSTLTDTLGRVFRLAYFPDGNLEKITQDRAAGPYTWVTFGYGSITLQPSFSGMSAVYGPTTPISVLTRVTFADYSSYTFDYNAFGQVHTVHHYAPDDSQLAYTGYNLPGSPWAGVSAQTDCPRFTERRDWVRYGVMNQSQEVVTAYSQAGDGSSTQETMPDGTIYKEFFATAGWARGLTTRTEVWSGGALKKYTTTDWTQDDTGLSYAKNPRITEQNVYDQEGNRSRTTIEYNSGYNLPTHVREWGGAGAGVLLRLTATAYKGDAAYVNNRVIGLPYERVVYDGPTGNVMSRQIYQYDWGSPYFTAQAPSTNYADPGYVVGRGNLIGVVRYNCANNTTAYDDNQAVWVEKNSYNTAGSVVWTEDAGAPRPSDGVVVAHRMSISYADSFSDGNNSRNTLAYPTQVTDPDGYNAFGQFNYDFGATTRTQDPKGAVITTQYDSLGRPDRVTAVATGAYTRYFYPADMGYVQSYAAVRDAANEVRSEQHFDGAGRVRASSVQFPGSAGGYRAVHYLYDSMGRRAQASNPTEINSSWVPTGDDAAGWVWTTQAYDWQGRPTVTTKPDAYTTELSYSGCGCAGGEVVTSRDERGRRRRLSKDVLGRPVKVEELNWDQSVYSTAVYAYNSRDQLTSARHYQGAGGAYQERSFAYDGFSRLASRTTPEQGTTTYSYNGDDTVSTTTDARGAVASFKYTGRHLLANINYTPGAGVAATPNVSFGYDEAGNRTSMSDGQGMVTYNYDTASRLTWEERTFTGLSPLRISYGYDVSGRLASVTNPWGSQVSFARDAAGQVTGVGGAGAVSASTYAQGLTYRAHGGVKQMTYGNGRQLNVSYDNRLRVRQWGVSGVVGWDYGYDDFGEHTGRVTLAQNTYDAAAGGRDGRLDRSYDYDQVGRLTYSTTGSNARSMVGMGDTPTQDGPYSQDYDYDVWGNLTTRAGWGGEAASYTASFDGKNQRVGFSYDASGNLTFDGGQHFSYDATGQQTYVDWTNMSQYYDGDRQRVKKNENGTVGYYLRSTALGGQVLAEVNAAGVWQRGYVYTEGGGLLAIQADGVVRWVHQDPVTKTQRVTDTAGSTVGRIELDPWGGVAGGGWTQNSQHQPRKFTTYERDGNGSDEAMMRRYNRWHSRFDQPDPYEGSYDVSDPQSFNRYAYAGNDPVNFADPTGLDECPAGMVCGGINEDGGTVHGGVGNTPVNSTPGIIVMTPPPGLTLYGPVGGSSGGGRGNAPSQQPVPKPVPEPPPPGEPLSPCVKSRLAPYFSGVNMDKVRVHEGLPAYVVGDQPFYTEGNDIYYKKGHYDPNTVGGLAVIGHEVTHVEQYAKLGTVTFQAQYLREYGKLRSLGLDHDSSYRGISLEVEARKRQGIIHKDLSNLSKMIGGKDPCPK